MARQISVFPHKIDITAFIFNHYILVIYAEKFVNPGFETEHAKHEIKMK